MRPRPCWLVLLVHLVLLLRTERAEAVPRRCVDAEPVVGTARCTRFGDDWAVERFLPLVLRAGARYSELSMSSTSWVSTTSKRGAIRYSGRSLGIPFVAAVGIENGVTLDLVRGLYVGVEGSLGYGAARPVTFTAPTGQTLANASGLDVVLWHVGAPIGYRLLFGPLVVRGEVSVGHVFSSLDQIAFPETSLRQSGTGRWLVEPRIAAEVWLTKHVSLGIYGGLNLVDGRSRAAGLTVSLHNRPYDGR